MNRMDPSEAVERVARELAKLLEDSGITSSDIRPTTSLIDDLALDSLKFVDLTLALEGAFGLEEFPMQEWVDSEAEKEGGFRVEALAAACLEAQSQEYAGGYSAIEAGP